jgi:hypothetical protein
MSDTDTYFQFPLCALAFGATEKERLEHIISFGFVEAGIAMFRKLDAEIREQKAKQFTTRSDTPQDYRKTNEHHVAAMIGAQEIGITVGGLEYSLNGWRELSSFRNQFQGRHGNDVQVRIRKGLVFEARDEEGISYRELAILCAVYSCIGAAVHPVRITKDTIKGRMLGYKSAKVMTAEIQTRTDHAQPLTARQIGYTLDLLHQRNFFARARPNERQTYFSHRLTAEQLHDELFKRKTARARFHATRKESNSSLMERIKSARQRLSQATRKNTVSMSE